MGHLRLPGAGAQRQCRRSALAYVTFIPAVIFLVLAPYNQKPVIKFHAIQELGLTLVGIILRIFWVVPFFGWVIGGYLRRRPARGLDNLHCQGVAGQRVQGSGHRRLCGAAVRIPRSSDLPAS